MVAIERLQEVTGGLSNGIILDDLESPLTRVSRSMYTYKSNISKGTNLPQNTNRKPYTVY